MASNRMSMFDGATEAPGVLADLICAAIVVAAAAGAAEIAAAVLLNEATMAFLGIAP